MKTASVREVQHHFSRVLEWVGRGEEVAVTFRNKEVARLVPSGVHQKPPRKWPDFDARWRELRRKGSTKGKGLGEVVLEQREERV